MKYLMMLVAIVFCLGTTVNAQTKSKKKVKTEHHSGAKKKVKENSSVFACPMHADVTSNTPGKCSKCGMDLKNVNYKNKGEAHEHTYYCPMKCEGDKTYEKPGSCPKCKMDLVKKG